MSTSRILSAAAAVALILGATGPVRAQVAATSAFTVLEDEAVIVQPFNITAEELEDMDIVGPTGDEIGEVDEVLTNAAGVLAVSAEVGGFLGIGEREVIVGLDQFRLIDGKLVTDLTKAQLEVLPEWDD